MDDDDDDAHSCRAHTQCCVYLLYTTDFSHLNLFPSLVTEHFDRRREATVHSRTHLYRNAESPTISSGVTLIAKFCVNILFLGCHTHFSHIAASLYAK